MGCKKIHRDVDLRELKLGVFTKKECKYVNEFLTEEFKDDGNGGERFELVKELGCGRDKIRTVYDRILSRYYKICRSVGNDKREHFFILLMQYYV